MLPVTFYRRVLSYNLKEVFFSLFSLSYFTRSCFKFWFTIDFVSFQGPLSGSEETGSTTSARLGRAEKLDDSSSASGVNALMSSTVN